MVTMSPATFGALLRRHRLAAGLTQEGLAELAGLSARGVQDLERGVRLAPRAETVRLLADALALDDAARGALIAAAHPELAPPPAQAPARPAPSRLPTPPTPLVGREREVAAACALLHRPEGVEGSRLLTLTGPGGVGKTRLALAVAAAVAGEFADGVVWVELGSLRDPDLVGAAVAGALGVREDGERPLAEILAAAITGQRLLLVLDNFEHVLAASPLIGQLLAATPHLSVLATSRARLRLRGEREAPVDPLAVPAAVEPHTPLAGVAGVAAVRLFVERAQAAASEFALTAENAGAVAAICRRLEGLPLALELAAARVKLLPPEALLTRLEQRLPLLSGGPRDAPDRQRTMRDAIAWSHDLLTVEEQIVFRRLAVFVGGFTLETAEHVGGRGGEGGVAALRGKVTADAAPSFSFPPLPPAPPERSDSPSVLDLITALGDQSLLKLVAQSGGEPRLTLLETVREFALERLDASGEAEAVRRAHADCFLALAEELDGHLTGPDSSTALDRLETEHDNLRAALAWAVAHDPVTAVRLTGALWRFWWLRGYLGEGRRWAEAALATGAGTPAERARAYHAAGDLAQEQGDYARAVPLLEAGLTAAREAGGREFAALCLGGLGFIARNRGNYADAVAFHDEALTLQREMGDRRAVACSLANLGSIAQNQREAARAEVLFAEALETFRALGHQQHAADVATNLAILANQSGEHERARRLAEEALITYRALADRQAIATAVMALANAERGQGNRSPAEARFREALDLFHEVDHQPGIATAQTHLAGMALDAENVDQALPLLADTLRILQQTGEKRAIAAALGESARAASALGRWEQAARLIGAAAALREAIGLSLSPAEDETRQQNAPVIAALGETTFAAAAAAGRMLPVAHAVAEALAIGG